MSQRRQWDRDAQPAPAWAQNLVRRSYLIEAQDDPGVERVFETSFPCAVGDIVNVPPSILAIQAGAGMWRIVTREDAPAPYVARLVVTPANS